MKEAIDTQCAKCGHDNTGCRYTPVGKKLWGKEATACQRFCADFKDSAHAETVRGTVTTECIAMHCRTCQFKWAVEVA